MPRAARLLALTLVLAACSSEGPSRFAVTVPPTEGRIAVGVRALEVREAELPLYADLEEIYIQTETGALVSDTEILWADQPSRTVTQGLVLALNDLTRARVAAEPWPFSDVPDARLEVRFDRLLAQNDGRFRISGQFFVTGTTDDRSSLGRFDIAVPYAERTPMAIADAQGRALAALAAQIAREAL